MYDAMWLEVDLAEVGFGFLFDIYIVKSSGNDMYLKLGVVLYDINIAK